MALKYNKIRISLAHLLIFALAFSVFTVNSSASEGTADAFHRATKSRVMLYPGGMPFGVRFNTKGLIIAGISEVSTENGSVSPGKASGLKVGDIISLVNSQEVNTPEELSKAINQDKAVTLQIIRNGKERSVGITPVKCIKDGVFRLGLFVRCECAGIGTVSYI